MERQSESPVPCCRHAIALGVFGCGYGLRAWSDADAVAARGAMARCLEHAVWAQGHMYCDVTAFHEPAH